VIPPAVRTTLMLLETQPGAEEILVERVKFLRHAERDGTYPRVLALLSGL
jgi:uncharacterized oxidoreductase